MTYALLAVGAALVLTVAAAVWVYLNAWRLARRRRVVVVLSDDVSVAGILWRSAGPLLVLRDAVIHADTASPVMGELVVERRQVRWVQVLP